MNKQQPTLMQSILSMLLALLVGACSRSAPLAALAKITPPPSEGQLNPVPSDTTFPSSPSSETLSTSSDSTSNNTSQQPISSSCSIQTPYSCPLHPDLPLVYADNFQDSANNKDRCLARAKDFAEWCFFAIGDSITSVFTDSAGIRTSQTHTVTESCMVTLPSICPQHPDEIGTLAIGVDPSWCSNSAQNIAQYCGFPSGATLFSTYRNNLSSQVMNVYVVPEPTVNATPIVSGNRAETGTTDSISITPTRPQVHGYREDSAPDLSLSISI